MTSQDDDPLSALEVDAQKLDRRALAEILTGLVGIDSEAGDVILLDGVREEATNAQLVALALLGQMALNLRDDEIEPSLKPKEIEAITGMSGGSVRPALKTLTDSGLLANREGTYRVHRHSLDALAEKLSSLQDTLKNDDN